MASAATGQYLAVMTMKYFRGKGRIITRTFGPYETRAGAAGKVKNIKTDLAWEIVNDPVSKTDSLELWRYDGIEYSFATSELWTPR